jgi:hypothetical protein
MRLLAGVATTILVASWTLALAASSTSVMGPCTTGSREVLGVPAPKTSQHMLRHLLSQNVTLDLQLLVDDFL